VRIHNILFTIVCTALLAGVALAADVTGKWTASVPGRNNNPREVVYNFKADGEKLTGTTSGMGGQSVEITDGKISGDDISFKTKVEFNGNSMVFSYKGKVSGDEIKFSMQREGGDQSREFTAKRAQ
jgi:hypothetical protein